MIKVNDALPAPPDSLWEGSPNKAVVFPTSGKFIVVGLPGAFTPPCSSHVPGYIASYKDFVAKGVSDIYIVAVNDIFVVNGWKAHLAKDSAVHFLSDSKAAFVKSLGLDFDATDLLGGVRSKRFVAVVAEGKVVSLNVESVVSDISVTAAEGVLASL